MEENIINNINEEDLGDVDNSIEFAEAIYNDEFIKALDIKTLKVLKFIEATYMFYLNKDKREDKKIKFHFMDICKNSNTNEINFLDKLVVSYLGFTLREYESSWTNDYENISKSLSTHCQYCHIKETKCPLKVMAYIKNSCQSEGIEVLKVIKNFLNEQEQEYVNNDSKTKEIANKVLKICSDFVSISGAEMLINSDAIKINEITEKQSILYTYINFKDSNNWVIDNIFKYYESGEGITEELKISRIKLGTNFSPIFQNSPYQLAAYILYLANDFKISPKKIFEKIYESYNSKERIKNLAYYRLQLAKIDILECDEGPKEQIKETLRYMRNYYFNKEIMPYIPFRIVLYTTNEEIYNEVSNIIDNVACNYEYIEGSWRRNLDVNNIVKKARDSRDLYPSIKEAYDEKKNTNTGVLLLKNITEIKEEKEERLSHALSALESAILSYPRMINIIYGQKEVLDNLMSQERSFAKMFDKRIEFANYDINYIKSSIIKILKTKYTYTDSFIEALSDYIDSTYPSNELQNKEYIDYLHKAITYNNFKKEENCIELTIDEIPEYDRKRNIKDILVDLNALIGIKPIKDKINELIALLDFNKKTNQKSTLNLHMVFTGNPGTGKTTVARMIAEILYHLGYVRQNKLIEVQLKDLIGEYVGWTGPKTQKVIDDSLDGVLFIDEAYSLTESKYAQECISTLIKGMEDNKERLVVIYAGYKKEMSEFLDINPGIKSRTGYEISFEDYSEEELMQIFESTVDKRGFSITEKAKGAVIDIIKNHKKVKNFGNARFVVNLFEKVLLLHAQNSKLEYDEKQLLEITEIDIPEVKTEESTKNKLGF